MATVAQMPLDSGPTDRRRRIVAIVGASSGNLVEWYDFYAYAFTSIYFAPAFFPASDPTSQLLATAGIFAVGFFMRPLGGWLFGWIADRHGRRPNANDFFNRWGDWSLGLKVAAPFGMLERGPC